MLVLAAVGSYLDSHGIVHNREAAATTAKLTAFALFLILGFSVVPLMLHFFIVAQGSIGNAEVGMLRFLRTHELAVTFGVWAMFTTGLLIALPVAWPNFFQFPVRVPKSQGTIAANVGMTIAETVARSTFKIPPGSRQSLTGSSTSVSQGVFDFELADAGVRFENCRYCWLETGNHDDPKIVHINVGISTQKMPRDKLTLERESIMGRLRVAGWSPGHYEYTDPEKIKLHGGAREGDGRYWAKGGGLLILSEKRMDDEQLGEDPKTAGEFIHVLDVLPRSDSSYKSLVFEPASATNMPVHQ